jgi:hypothetical protein
MVQFIRPIFDDDPEEEERRTFPEVAAAMVHDGTLTATTLDEIRDDLRDFAEQAIAEHQDRIKGPCSCDKSA